MAENGIHHDLTPQQHRAIAALLTSRDVRSAAKAAHVNERTLHRWLSDARFVAELNAHEGMLIDHATRRLVGLQDAAIDTLQTILDSDVMTPTVKLRAAIASLDLLLKLRELRNVETRLNALECILIQENRYGPRESR